MKKLTQRQLVIITVAAAVFVAVVVIAVQILGNNSPGASASARYAKVPQSRLQDGGFLLGNPDAPVTIIEFADFACPHCQEYEPQIDQFINDFVITGKAKLEYRMFISGADPTYGPYTAQLAECAATLREGAFWPAHDILFAIGRAQGRFNERTARSLADQLGLNYSSLLECAQNAKQYQTDVRLGESMNVSSTPTIMVQYGNNAPQYINDGTQTYDRGGVPYQILAAVVQLAQ